MLLLIILVLLILYGTGAFISAGWDILQVLLILAVIGVVYQLWMDRRSV